MFVQTEITPNPNALKFIPGKVVSNSGSFEITKKEEVNNELIRNLLSINGVKGVFLGTDFLSVNKEEKIDWEKDQDFKFVYEIGLAPDFDVNITAKDKLDYYKIEADSQLIDKYCNDIAKKYGKMSNPEVSVEGDLIYCLIL